MLTRETANDYLNLYGMKPEKYSIIPNGVNVKKILEEARNVDNLESESSDILFYGRLFARKGAEYLIRAMPSILQENPKLTLTIIGTGPQESRLRNLVQKLSLEKKVHLKGEVPRKVLISHILASSLVVFPSLYEVQSTSVLESMALKKPVVAFKIPAMDQIISNMETGVLVPDRNIAQLSRALTTIISDVNLQKKIVNSAFDYVKKEHDWKMLALRYVQMYKEALND